MSTRSALYRALRLSNDVRAVRRGKIGPRLVRRGLGRLFSREVLGRIR